MSIFIQIGGTKSDHHSFTRVTDGIEGLRRVVAGNVKAFKGPYHNEIQAQIDVIGVQCNYMLIFQGEDMAEVVALLKSEKQAYNRIAAPHLYK